MPDSNPLIPPLSGARSILVVDDAAVVRRLAFRILAEAGYRVFEAGSAAEPSRCWVWLRGAWISC